jgi:anthranilate synthase component 1
MKPYFRKLVCDSETPVSIFTKLALKRPYAFLLESAEPHEKAGRYSVIGFDAQKLFVFPANGTANLLKILQAAFEEFSYKANPELPRLQAPLVGYFSYEVARHFENLKIPLQREIPEGIFFLPKNLLLFDHFERTLTAIAYDEQNLKNLIAEIEQLKHLPGPSPSILNTPPSILNTPPSILNTPPSHFQNLVSAAKENICAGDVVQIVLSQNFQAKTNTPPFDLYRRLRILSPSPYMYYLQYPDFSIIGSSPETLVRTEDEDIVIRPIAGTRRRGKTPEEDARLAENLKQDIKEQAEHMMLVDLGRNDIGRVAEPGSVKVTRLMELEKYSHVMHLVSEVRGKRGDAGLFEIFKAAFPAGTLTGAPKIRAMELIAEFEKQPRGIYGGAVGYFDLSGNMDFAIAIRTMLYQNGIVNLRAGAGIVYDSVPANENLECHNKARGPLTALV